MKKRICFSVLALTLLASVGAAMSASARSGSRATAQIPFDFHVGDREVPAGVYTVERANDDGSLLRIVSLDARRNVFVTTYQADSDGGRGSRLVFRKYGERYFLASVWDGTDGRSLPQSGTERGMRKTLRASLGEGSEAQTVTVAARVED